VDYAHTCDALEAAIGDFAATVRGIDPSTAVATCPGWDIAALVKHSGYGHRWVEHIVHTRAETPVRFRDVEMGLPEAESAYADWLEAGRQRLLATLRAADPNEPIWAWGADKRVRFWAGRQLFETTLHHTDALLTLGRQPAIDADTAVDGIDEFLDNLPHAVDFAPNVKELKGNGESLHFHCTDAEGEWMIQLNPDGFSWEHGHGKGSVAVRGSASDLLLLIYGRRKPDGERFQIFGEEAVLARWLENAHM